MKKILIVGNHYLISLAEEKWILRVEVLSYQEQYAKIGPKTTNTNGIDVNRAGLPFYARDSSWRIVSWGPFTVKHPVLLSPHFYEAFNCQNPSTQVLERTGTNLSGNI